MIHKKFTGKEDNLEDVVFWSLDMSKLHIGNNVQDWFMLNNGNAKQLGWEWDECDNISI